MFRAGSYVVATGQHVACDVGTETVILGLDDGIYFGLNKVGAHVWKLIQKPRHVTEIVQAIQERFAVDEARCQADLEELMLELERHKLVCWSDAPSK